MHSRLQGPRTLHTKLQITRSSSIHNTIFLTIATIFSAVLYMGNNFHIGLFGKIVKNFLVCQGLYPCLIYSLLFATLLMIESLQYYNWYFVNQFNQHWATRAVIMFKGRASPTTNKVSTGFGQHTCSMAKPALSDVS